MPKHYPDARVLIMERIVADPSSPSSAAADMVTLNIGGKERTADNFDAVVERASLNVVRIHRKQTTEVGMVECALA